MPGLHARLTPYYKTLNFDESHIKDIMEKNSIKNQNTEGNNNYSGEPMPFFNIMNGDIEIMGSIKNRLKNWLDTMSATFKIADEKTKLGVFKEKCSKLIL